MTRGWSHFLQEGFPEVPGESALSSSCSSAEPSETWTSGRKTEGGGGCGPPGGRSAPGVEPGTGVRGPQAPAVRMGTGPPAHSEHRPPSQPHRQPRAGSRSRGHRRDPTWQHTRLAAVALCGVTLIDQGSPSVKLPDSQPSAAGRERPCNGGVSSQKCNVVHHPGGTGDNSMRKTRTSMTLSLKDSEKSWLSMRASQGHPNSLSCSRRPRHVRVEAARQTPGRQSPESSWVNGRWG